MDSFAWPFLVGRNRTLGYQVIVSPQLLAENALSHLLIQIAGGDESPPACATLREIRGTQVGKISVVFRITRPQAQEYGIAGTDILRDEGGRPIRLIEGFVVPQRMEQVKKLQLTQDDFQIVHQQVKEAYRAFWEADETFPEQVSQLFYLKNRVERNEQVTLKAEHPLEVPLSLGRKITSAVSSKLSRKTLALATALIVLILVATGIYVLNEPTPDKSLQTFCHELQQSDSRQAYDQLSDNKRHTITLASFTQSFFATNHRVVACTYYIDTATTTIAHATLHLIFSDNSQPVVMKISLIKAVTGDWQIDSLPLTDLQQDRL